MITDDVNVAVREFIRRTMNIPGQNVRPADQASPSGSQTEEVVTVRIMSCQNIGHPAQSFEDDGMGGTNEVLQVPKRVIVSLNFYRGPAEPGSLESAQVSQDTTLYTGVTTGGFDVLIDGVLQKVHGIDLHAIATMTDLAVAVQAKLPAGVTCVWTGQELVISSSTTGQTSAVEYAAPPTYSPTPVDVSTLLGLTEAAGATSDDDASGIAKYNNAAVDRAQLLETITEFGSSREILNELGLGLTGIGPVRNLSTSANDATWESRAQVDWTFNVIEKLTMNGIATVQSALLGLTIQQPDNVLQTRSIEVSP